MIAEPRRVEKSYGRARAVDGTNPSGGSLPCCKSRGLASLGKKRARKPVNLSPAAFSTRKEDCYDDGSSPARRGNFGLR